MAEQIISPGVFTRENDLSFLPQGVGAIGAAIIGPTVKGPAFVPTVVRSFAEFERRFGPLSSDTYVPQTVREYLKNAGSVTVCRVLAGGGYTYTNGTNSILTVNATPSGSAKGGIILGVLFPSKDIDANPTLHPSLHTNGLTSFDAAENNTGSMATASIELTLSSSDTATVLTGSINPSDSTYLFKQIGFSADNSKNGANSYSGTPGFTYINFKNLQTDLLSDGGITGYGNDLFAQHTIDHGINSSSLITITTQSAVLEYKGGPGLTSTTEGYGYASTPVITSQFLDANKTTKDLFTFHTLDHGKHLCHEYKISISNLREPADIDGEEQYSTFSVLVRKTNDTDKNPVILEQFNNCNLNPDSSQYIARVIGDRYPQYNQTLDKVELLGNYPNISNYIRVEMNAAVDAKSTSPKLSPSGFAALYNPIATASLATNMVFPSSSFEGTQTLEANGTTYSSKGFLGFKFLEKERDNEAFLQPIPTTLENNVAGAFNVGNFSVHPSASITFKGSLSASLTTTGTTGPTANEVKFTIPFQGGDDGIGSHVVKQIGEYITNTNLYGFDLSSTNAAGYTGYKKALDILSNQDEYDINMLVTPGVIKNKHSLVTDAALDMAETRGDAFYVMDLSMVDASINQAVSDADGLDSNYAAVYYPWVKVLDSSINKPVLVPPSVIVPGAIAASDRIAAEWFAPAGLNRGVLGNVLEAKIRLNQAERDTLYNAKINPIATFPQTGVCIWGQKTLQSRPTALDRINVRRLLIALKKFIASSSRYLVFEQNTIQTRNRFLNIVNPYLESVQQRQGLYAFRVQMDDSNNTPDIVDRNQLVGAIYLQPTKTAEFIILDFNVLPTGATFDGGGSAGGAGGTGGGGGY